MHSAAKLMLKIPACIVPTHKQYRTVKTTQDLRLSEFGIRSHHLLLI